MMRAAQIGPQLQADPRWRTVYEVRIGGAWVRCFIEEWMAFPDDRRRVSWRLVEDGE